MKKNEDFIEELKENPDIRNINIIEFRVESTLMDGSYIGLQGDAEKHYKIVKSSESYLDFNENDVLIRVDHVNNLSKKELKEIILIVDKYYDIHPTVKNLCDIPLKKSEVYL